jgi:cellulose synthase/poly-beta-1,6-N-acetylglucosamine synthase-like glycosyltransferase
MQNMVTVQFSKFKAALKSFLISACFYSLDDFRNYKNPNIPIPAQPSNIPRTYIHRLALFETKPKYSGIKLFELLPNDIKNTVQFSKFKAALKSAQRLHMDATFKVLPQHLGAYQLLTVHADHQNMVSFIEINFYFFLYLAALLKSF